MDTTKEYFKQCSKADEIQNKWKFELGDYFTTPQMNAHFTTPFMDDDFCIVDDFWIEDELTKRTLPDRMKTRSLVWLPKQEQLQEILKTQTKHIHKDSMGYKNGRYPEGFICLCLMAEFETFLDSEYQYIDYIGFNSMEQLWLAFTMDKKYNKRWSEGEWVKA